MGALFRRDRETTGIDRTPESAQIRRWLRRIGLRRLPSFLTAEQFLAELSAQRGRELRLTEVAGMPAHLCGAWVATEELDAIIVDAELSGPRRDLVILHEAAHVLFQHRSSGDLARLGAAAELARSLSDHRPVAALARSHFDTRQEWEAEWLATYLVSRGMGLQRGSWLHQPAARSAAQLLTGCD